MASSKLLSSLRFLGGSILNLSKFNSVSTLGLNSGLQYQYQPLSSLSILNATYSVLNKNPLNGTGTTFLNVINAAGNAGGSVRNISTTSSLFAEPLKKKKKMDPAIIKAREARKLRKLEKTIRRLEKNARQLKPLDELQVPVVIIDQARQRRRVLPPLTSEEVESRWLLQKEMTKFKFEQHSIEIRHMEKLLKSQNKALQELNKVSEDLYFAAIDFDSTFIPYEVKGPVETPPISNYLTPEGDYIDISRKWM